MRFSFSISFLVTFLLICGICTSAYADENRNDISTYNPPPMFGEPNVQPVERKILIKDSGYSRIISGTADILPPINKRTGIKKIEHIFPPVPPRRPSKFSVSPEFLNGMRNGNVHKQAPDINTEILEHSLEITPMGVDEIYKTLSDSGLE